MAAKIRKGDKVIVLNGRDKGRTGEVFEVPVLVPSFSVLLARLSGMAASRVSEARRSREAGRREDGSPGTSPGGPGRR